MHVSDVAEDFVSVTDIKQYTYRPRIVYFERVLHATPIFGLQQGESKELHEDYVAKELRRKDAIYYSPESVEAEKFRFNSLCSKTYGLQTFRPQIAQVSYMTFVIFVIIVIITCVKDARHRMKGC